MTDRHGSEKVSDKTRGFQPGELAVLQHATHFHEYNGWLVEILDRPSERWTMDLRTMERRLVLGYPVKLICDNADELPYKGVWRCMPWQLRRLGRPDIDLEQQRVAAGGKELRFTSPEAVQDLEHQDS